METEPLVSSELFTPPGSPGSPSCATVLRTPSLVALLRDCVPYEPSDVASGAPRSPAPSPVQPRVRAKRNLFGASASAANEARREQNRLDARQNRLARQLKLRKLAAALDRLAAWRRVRDPAFAAAEDQSEFRDALVASVLSD